MALLRNEMKRDSVRAFGDKEARVKAGRKKRPVAQRSLALEDLREVNGRRKAGWRRKPLQPRV